MHVLSKKKGLFIKPKRSCYLFGGIAFGSKFANFFEVNFKFRSPSFSCHRSSQPFAQLLILLYNKGDSAHLRNPLCCV